jgi:signal transduction histidine kinase/ActR/RegA family two-component response regulator
LPNCESELAQAFLDATHDAVAVLDDAYRIQFANPEFCRLFDFASPAGRSIFDGATDLWETSGLKSHLEQVGSHVRRWEGRRGHQSLVFSARRIENPVRIVMAVRPAIEQDLERQTVLLESIVNNLNDGIIVADEHGNFLVFNPAARSMVGVGPKDSASEEEQGLMLSDMKTPCPVDEHPVVRAIRGEEFNDVELYIRDQFISCSGRPLQGPLRGGIVVLRNMTDRRRLEQQFRQAQKMEAVGRLAGGVAHDFNNLLTAILGYGELILPQIEPDSPIRSDLLEIKKAAERAAALTQQLLAFSRRQTLQPRVLNLNEVVKGIHNLVQRLIGEDIRLCVKLDPVLWRIRADAGQLEQVIMNLVVNARDAMPHGGTLTLETANVDLDESFVRRHIGSSPGPHVLLAVSDTGQGMTKEVQAHIFEPFFTTKELGKGTGLGLSTVYGIVKQSEGYIQVYSEVGCGTTFKVYLPRCASSPEASPAVAPPPARTGTEKILLVEDEEGVRALARRILEGQGYTVLTASDAREALAVLNDPSNRIDLMLTDMVMPHMTGRDLAEKARELRPGLKILYMSGYTSTMISNQGLLDRDAVILLKPFTPDSLTRTIRQALEAGAPAGRR